MTRANKTGPALALLFAALLTGCGANPNQLPTTYGASGYDTSSYGASGYTDPSAYGGTADPYGTAPSPTYSTPGYAPTPPYGTTPAPVGANGLPTTYAPTLGVPVTPVVAPAPAMPANVLTATITGIDQSGLFGLGHVTAHVEVDNPTHGTLSGRLAVQFTEGGQPTGNLYTEKVTLAAGATKSLVFTSSAWKVNSAEADIETNAAQGTSQSTVTDAP